MLEDEIANGIKVVAPDRVGHPTRQHEARPARNAVAARERELCVGELRGVRLDPLGMVLLELGDRGPITLLNGAEQILRLMLQLLEIGTYRKSNIGHDG